MSTRANFIATCGASKAGFAKSNVFFSPMFIAHPAVAPTESPFALVEGFISTLRHLAILHSHPFDDPKTSASLARNSRPERFPSFRRDGHGDPPFFAFGAWYCSRYPIVFFIVHFVHLLNHRFFIQETMLGM
jgi:hypothetical protein